jgi:hypothetical protein
MTSYSTLIRPREGHTYEAAVTYKSGLFTIDIVEIAPQKALRRNLLRQDISSCAAGRGGYALIPGPTPQRAPARKAKNGVELGGNGADIGYSCLALASLWSSSSF